MQRISTTRFTLMLVVAIALLLTRVAGAHLHLCFDGGEAPATMHLEDASVHHNTPGASETHHDVDVSAAGGLLSKLNLDELGLLFAVLLLWYPVLIARRLIPEALAP